MAYFPSPISILGSGSRSANDSANRNQANKVQTWTRLKSGLNPPASKTLGLIVWGEGGAAHQREFHLLGNVTILGTGLIGASVGLALRASGYTGEIHGWDHVATALDAAFELGAITKALPNRPTHRTLEPGIIVLAGPVLSTLDWMELLAPHCGPSLLLTDVGSTKRTIAEAAQRLGYNTHGRARFLPGHPMAGKERGGPELAEATLFHEAMWLFTPIVPTESPLDLAWREQVTRFGARTLDLTPTRHDEICAWVSHLPQMLSTALAALLESRFADDPKTLGDINAIGGRALRETTRLGASPYTMWRDVALTNTQPIAETLHALEQALAHLRENLRTPELREEFTRANRFRSRPGKTATDLV